VGQTEPRAGDRGDHRGIVVGRDHGAQRMRRREGGELFGGALGMPQVEGDRLCRLKILERLVPVGADHRLDAETRRRLQEIVRPIGVGRQEQQDARGAGRRRGGPAAPAIQTRSSMAM